MKISIIIPAYNEEKRISETLEDYGAYAKKRNAEIIVVCDGTDKTAKIAKRFKGVRIIKFPKRLGKGGALIEGFKAAKGGIIGYVDADDATASREFEKLVSEVLGGSDSAIASRRISGSKVIEHGNYLKKFGSNLINIIARYVFGLDIRDAQCGAKIFRKDVLEDVLPLMRSTGFEFDLELLWRIKGAGYSIKEVPITWHGKDNSKFSMRESPKMLFNLILRRIGF